MVSRRGESEDDGEGEGKMVVVRNRIHSMLRYIRQLNCCALVGFTMLAVLTWLVQPFWMPVQYTCTLFPLPYHIQTHLCLLQQPASEVPSASCLKGSNYKGCLLLQLLFQHARDPCSEEDLAQTDTQGRLLQLQTLHNHIGCLLVGEVLVGASLSGEEALIAPAEGSECHVLRKPCSAKITHTAN